MRIVLLTISSAIGISLGLAAIGCSDPPAIPVAPEQLDPLLEAALGATRTEYGRLRGRIVQLGRGAIPLLRAKAANGKSWQERCLAEICLEHVEHAKAVRALFAKPAGRMFHRERWERVRVSGRNVARRCRRTPMIVVEKLWKDNELPMGGDSYEHQGYLAYALGLLKEARGRPAIELALSNYQPQSSQLVALRGMICGLGKLGHPDSATALLKCSEEDPESFIQAYAAMALAECIKDEPAATRRPLAAKATRPSTVKVIENPKKWLRIWLERDHCSFETE